MMGGCARSCVQFVMPPSPRMKNAPSGQSGQSGPRGAAAKNKKRGGPKDDGSDVDEHGNIEDLIDYDYESDDDDSMTSSEKKALKKGKLPASVKKGLGARIPRRAAVKAGRRIKKQARRHTESSDSTYVSRHDLPKNKRLTVIESEESEGETLGSEDTDDEDEEDEEDDDEDDYDEDAEGGPYGFSISIGNAGPAEPDSRLVPTRHKMKKESESVQKFVKLVTAPTEVDTIDDQIDQFKELSADKQTTLLTALEKRSEYVKKEQPLMFRLLQMNLKPEMMAMVMSRYNAMNQMDPASGEYYKLRSWMEKLVSIPLGVYKDMPRGRLCTLHDQGKSVSGGRHLRSGGREAPDHAVYCE